MSGIKTQEFINNIPNNLLLWNMNSKEQTDLATEINNINPDINNTLKIVNAIEDWNMNINLLSENTKTIINKLNDVDINDEIEVNLKLYIDNNDYNNLKKISSKIKIKDSVKNFLTLIWTWSANYEDFISNARHINNINIKKKIFTINYIDNKWETKKYTIKFNKDDTISEKNK